MVITIYTLKDPSSDQVRYVGKTNNLKKRYWTHLSAKTKSHTTSWIKKLLLQGYKPIMEVLEITSMEEWISTEQYWIAQFKAWGFPLTNQTLGVEGSYGHAQYTWTDEHRRQGSQRHKGKVWSQSSRDQISEALKNRPHTKSQCINIGLGNKRFYENNPRYTLHLFKKGGLYINTFHTTAQIHSLIGGAKSGVLNVISGRAKSVKGFNIHRINCIRL